MKKMFIMLCGVLAFMLVGCGQQEAGTVAPEGGDEAPVVAVDEKTADDAVEGAKAVAADADAKAADAVEGVKAVAADADAKAADAVDAVTPPKPAE